MQKFCFSCGMPVGGKTAGPAENYCVYCTDDQGTLKARNEIRDGIGQWMQQWQGVDRETALKRAERYMAAMPAWAEQ